MKYYICGGHNPTRAIEMIEVHLKDRRIKINKESNWGKKKRGF